MNILDLIVYVAVGVIGGGCMGYAMGATSPRRCVECLDCKAQVKLQRIRRGNYVPAVEVEV